MIPSFQYAFAATKTGFKIRRKNTRELSQVKICLAATKTGLKVLKKY